jgi:hydroxymethylpyrimidine/phosphomethylpyrimidine kinase
VNTARILIIAGSDSGGGAGVQADIKTVTMLGGHAMTAITAITAQNTLGVDDVFPLPSDIVDSQLRSVMRDIGADAIKIGMLGTAELATSVDDFLRWGGIGLPIVLDPVMVATSGDSLNEHGTAAVIREMLSRVTVATPNLPELEILTGATIADAEAMERAASALAEQAGCAVLAKGGHLTGNRLVDVLARPGEPPLRWEDARIDTTSTHGTGCTLSSAIATGLGQGMGLPDAIDRGRKFVRAALRAAPGLGQGHGPMGHQAVRDL